VVAVFSKINPIIHLSLLFRSFFMLSSQINKLGLVVCLTVALGACSSTKPKETEPTPPPNQISTEPSAQTTPIDTSLTTPSELAAAEAAMLRQNVIHFDYDRSDIRDSDRAVLDAHGRYLAANPGVSVRLEGHADERGSREYNLALGERRAQAVERYLGILGVSDSQMNLLSYGEEKPLAFGKDEYSWQQNRRVEIIYPQGLR
jgi:peptidoglycan-associated lipoprotein